MATNAPMMVPKKAMVLISALVNAEALLLEPAEGAGAADAGVIAGPDEDPDIEEMEEMEDIEDFEGIEERDDIDDIADMEDMDETAMFETVAEAVADAVAGKAAGVVETETHAQTALADCRTARPV